MPVLFSSVLDADGLSFASVVMIFGTLSNGNGLKKTIGVLPHFARGYRMFGSRYGCLGFFQEILRKDGLLMFWSKSTGVNE